MIRSIYTLYVDNENGTLKVKHDIYIWQCVVRESGMYSFYESIGWKPNPGECKWKEGIYWTVCITKTEPGPIW